MMRKSTRGVVAVLAGLVLTTLAAVNAWGKHGIVTTQDGSQSFEGEITESGDFVTIVRNDGTKVKVNRANIQPIQYFASNKDQFNQRLGKLAKNDSAGRVELARWAVDKKEYDLAMDALDGAIAIDPNNEDAIKMQRSVQTQRRLAHKTAATGAAATPPANGKTTAATPVADPEPATRPAGPKKLRLVTMDEINHIRQLELQKTDSVRFLLQNDVKRRYVASAEGISTQEFNKMTPQQQGMEILNNGSSKLKPDVIIATDPSSMATFKSVVLRNVLPGCATASCHVVGGKAGDFVLYNPATKDPEAYTNYLLMQNYKMTTNGKESLMIDRTRPENSLVLEFGLPVHDAQNPHPDVQNLHPLFKGKNDPKYKQILDWMNHALAPVAPEYGIDLTKEPEKTGGNATTRPSAR